MVNIRQGVISDIGPLLDLAEKFILTTGFKDYPLNRDKVRQLLVESLYNPSLVLIVAEKDDKFAGVVLASIREMWFSDEKTSYDIIVYADPCHRTPAVIKALIGAYLTWAKNKGARMISLGVSTMVNEERIARLYNILGFKTVGTQHRYGV